jgi:hypothetical protein
MNARDYSLFGLRVRSELALPELVPATGEEPADVLIRYGQAGAAEAEAGLHSADDDLLYVAPDVGSYRIAGGKEIIVDPRPGTPERNIRLYLLGSAFGALLHQRGMLPLHANAVEIDSRAVAIMGSSGEGKSTLAAWFHDHGYRIVADDVCVVKFGADSRAYATTGLPRLRLWAETLEATGRDASEFDRSYVSDVPWDKYDVPVARSPGQGSELELAALFVLERADEMAIEPLSGVAAAEAVFANTYRGAFVSAARQEQAHWSACMQLVRRTPVYRLARPRGLDLLDQQCRELVDFLRGKGW